MRLNSFKFSMFSSSEKPSLSMRKVISILFLGKILKPKVGASWEGFVLEQVLFPNAEYFWGTHAGAELDLVFQSGENRYGIEIKFNEAPTLTPSMRIASLELSLEHLWIVFPGNETYPIMKKITSLPVKNLEMIREKNK